MTFGADSILGELRGSLPLSEAKVAQRLGIGPRALQALEATRLDRVTVATLRAYVEALGGSLELVMPDGRREVLS